MTTEAQIGAILDAGLHDWQILQQPCVVQVRVVAGDTGVAVNRSLDWQAAATETDGRWQITLRVPAGGLYRLETRCLFCLPRQRLNGLCVATCGTSGASAICG